jgi:hypothetical protein
VCLGGNALGALGLRMLLRCIGASDLKVEFIDGLVDATAPQSAHPSAVGVWDPMAPSGRHKLDLSCPYGQVVASELLTLRDEGVGRLVSAVHDGHSYHGSAFDHLDMPDHGVLSIEFEMIRDPTKAFVSDPQYTTLLLYHNA